jgi:ADP-ribose pyrophosphatase YjhB (NUDIX family)
MRRSKRRALRVSWSDGPAGRSGAPTWRNGEAFQGVDASATSESGSESWTSAGGVVIREGSDEGREVVLVGRGRRVRWALPKGTQRPGEPLEGTAVREVQEETGLRVRRLRPLGEIHYRFKLAGVRYDKTIHFYLMQATGGDMWTMTTSTTTSNGFQWRRPCAVSPTPTRRAWWSERSPCSQSSRGPQAWLGAEGELVCRAPCPRMRRAGPRDR